MGGDGRGMSTFDSPRKEAGLLYNSLFKLIQTEIHKHVDFKLIDQNAQTSIVAFVRCGYSDTNTTTDT